MRGPVAKRYARALLEIGVAHANLPMLQRQVRDLATMFDGSDALQAIVSNPGVTMTERRAVVEAVAKKSAFHAMVRNFAMLLLDNARFDHVGGIADELDAMADEHQGNVRAHVTTSTALKDSQVASIKGAIAALTGKKVLLETDVDPDIIGGIVTRVGNTVYDGSVRSQLNTIRDSILREV